MGSQLPLLNRSELQDRFLRELESWGPTPPPPDEGQFDLLYAHHEELRRWNPRLSLVGPGTAPQVVERHYVESWAGSALLDASDRHLVDVGTGAGFPGLVLAVARPDLRVSLIEPNGRKVAFLQAALRAMGRIGTPLRCTVLDARVNGSLPPALDPSPAGPAAFPDVVTSRALAWTPSVRDPFLESFPESSFRPPRFLLWIGREFPVLDGPIVLSTPIALSTSREVNHRNPQGSSQGKSERVERRIVERRIVEIIVDIDPSPTPTPRKKAP